MVIFMGNYNKYQVIQMNILTTLKNSYFYSHTPQYTQYSILLQVKQN